MRYTHSFFIIFLFFVQTACASECNKELAQNTLDTLHNGNASKAYKMIKSCAEQGNARSESVLGYLYTYETNNPYYNIKKGLEWHRKAAQQGNAEAQFMCGLALDLSRVHLDDEAQKRSYYNEALEWFKKAADQGHPRAMAQLAQYYEERTFEPETAYFWYLLAKRKYSDKSMWKKFTVSFMNKMEENGEITKEGIERATARADKWDKDHPNVLKVWPVDDWIDNM